MQNPFKCPFKSIASVALGLCFLSGAPWLDAQSITINTLHRFSASDGINPYYGLTQGPNGILYGTCVGVEKDGGAGGSVFGVNPDGTGFTVLHTFSPTEAESAYNTGGANPLDGPLLIDGLLYGVTEEGGSGAYGVIYRMTTNGGNYTVLEQFNASTAEYQQCGLAQGSDGFLYGTGDAGGDNDTEIYKIDTNGNNYATLVYFSPSSGGYNYNPLLSSPDGNLYGVTGGDSDSSGDLGLVFKLTTGGTYTTLHTMAGNDGSASSAALIEDSSGTLYGTASASGAKGYGTLFRVSTNGANFTVIYTFGTNGDGQYPIGRLLLASDGYLYGSCEEGGSHGYGTIFRMATNGANYQVLYNFTGTFTATGDHGYPNGCLIEASNGMIYGMCGDVNYNYTTVGNGTIFELVNAIAPPGVGIQGINRVYTSPTNLNSVSWTVTFAAAVTGLSAANFQLAASGLTGSPAVTSVTGSGATWTVTASTGSGNGTLQLNLANATGLSPTVTNALPYSGQSYSIDLVPPTITIGSPSASLVSTNAVSYPVTYFDTNFNTSTLAADNITLNATGTANAGSIVVTGSGTNWTVTLSGISGQGTLGISIAAGTASDLAGNLAPAAGPSATFSVALTPLITVQPAPQSVLAPGNATFSVTATGTSPLVYQWSKDGAVLTTATNYAALSLTNVNRASVGYYSVTVSNEVGLAASTNVLLRVLIPQKFSQVLQPQTSSSPTFQALFQDSSGTVATLWYATNFFQMLGSTNLLSDWEPVSGTMSLTNGFILFQDSDPTNVALYPYRFYRIEEQ
jgi:uncharacterized repeat protein (TIGR03803 family)